MVRITDPTFVYTPAAKTDIRRTFRKHGFVGPEEAKTKAQASSVWIAPGITVTEVGFTNIGLPGHRIGD